jgi:hypothetical protein
MALRSLGLFGVSANHECEMEKGDRAADMKLMLNFDHRA